MYGESVGRRGAKRVGNLCSFRAALQTFKRSFLAKLACYQKSKHQNCSHDTENLVTEKFCNHCMDKNTMEVNGNQN